MCNARRLPRRRKAFTLIELLVVMALILAIAAIGIGYVVFGQDNQHSVHRRQRRHRGAAQRQAAGPPRRRADRHSHPVRHATAERRRRRRSSSSSSSRRTTPPASCQGSTAATHSQ